MTSHFEQKPIVLIIGSGRLARHLQHWAQLSSLAQILMWDRHQDPHLIRRQLNQCTHVWLAISDKAILPFYEQYIEGFDHIVVHFSGALSDPRIYGAHPMMSFSHDLLEDGVYPKIQFAVDHDIELSKLLPGFKNPFFKIAPQDKALYHALCVVAGNFPQLLWKSSESLFSKLNVPESASQLYIQQVTQNYLMSGASAVTGPLVRNDQKTLELNQQALANTQLAEIYAAFVKEFSNEKRS